MESESAMPAADAASAVIDVLAARIEDAVPDGQLPGLAQFLAKVPDRRRARGRRHRLVTILLLACAAVAAGSKSLAAIGEWAGRAPQWLLAAAGARRDRRAGTLIAPPRPGRGGRGRARCPGQRVAAGPGRVRPRG